jgi:excisionase family DNA binding protein
VLTEVAALDPVLVPIWPDTGKLLGLGRSTVFRLVREGQLASVRVGRRRLMPVKEIHAFADRLAEHH